MVIVNNPELVNALSNCTEQVQMFSEFQTDSLAKISSLQSNFNVSLIILALIGLFLVFLGIYFFARRNFAYRLGILRNGIIQWHWKWNIEKLNVIKHGKNDVFTYVSVPEAIKGTTILWYYKNPNPIIFDETNNKADSLAMSLDTLKRSTVIEKFVTAEDFMTIIKVLIIVILVLCLIGIVFEYIIYKKPLLCNVMLDNVTIASEVIK